LSQNTRGGEKVVKTAVIEFQKSGVIEFSPDLCVGCGSCMLMCALYHEGVGGPALARIQMERDPLNGEYQARICRQCLAPSCYVACPDRDQALCIDETTGVRYIDPAYCTACKECVKACPFEPSRVYLYAGTGIAYKCDLCVGREGGPICIEYCPVDALSIVAAEKR
jgi:Fe-S-cluster-containing hydrogenase component 2